MNIIQIPSQHTGERQAPIDILVFHSTAYPLDKALKTYADAEVSPHYVICENGDVVQCVAENTRCCHAGGDAFWRGINNDLNSHSIGIEVLNSTLGQSEFSQEQIISTLELSREIITRHNILPQNIVGHSDIVPLRKPDPGKCFFWKKLAENGIGLWYDLNHRSTEQNINALLSTIGYNTGTEQVVAAASYAFCRRYLPQLVTVVPDVLELLENVLPDDFSFMQEEIFLKTLQAVAFNYANSADLPISY
jgi:N-acetylmuramoyl-L-alanine amidase